MASLPAEFTFDADAHVYRVGGVRWPSVTEILEPLQLLDGIPKHVLEAAAKFGTNVHAACHLHNLGILDERTLDPHLQPYINAWHKFLHDTGARVVASEMRVAHQRLRYAGTLDTICLIGKHRTLVDIKSTAEIPRTTGPQTAAYAEAVGEPRIYRRVVQLKADGTYRCEPLNDRADWNLFLSVLNVHNWRTRYAAA
jgi:hypothetical protein